MEIPQSQFPCRGAEADSHGPDRSEDEGDSPSFDTLIRRSMSLLARDYMGEVPNLHLEFCQ